MAAPQEPLSVTTPVGAPKSMRSVPCPNIELPLTVPLKCESGVSTLNDTAEPLTVPLIMIPL